MRSNIISIIVGLILTAAVLFLSAIPSETSKLLVTRMNYIAYDLILSSLSPGKVPKNNNVVIVDIDDKSLQEIGRWPWHRDVLAGLIKKLQNDGAVVIALDVIFPEYEDNIVEKILNSQKNNSSFDEQVKTNLLKVKPLFDYDNILSDTLSASDTVVGVFFEANKGHYAGHLTNEWLSISKDFSSNLLIPRMENYTSSNYKIVAGAKNLGSVTTIPDEDGVIRRTPLLFHYNNKIYPSLALEAVKLYYLVDKPRIVFAPAARFNAVLGIDLNTVYIPTDASGRMFVPFVGKGYTFPYFSAADVIKNRIKKGTFSDRGIV
jgi:adenylate cyclase